MTTTIEAIYEGGVLKLPRALPLPDKARVVVTIQAETDAGNDSERAAWLKLSQENLMKTWDNAADDAFNELLEK